MKPNYVKLSPQQILKEYTFPHTFYVRFLLDIAKYKISLVNKPHPKALDCINITELWLKNKATAEECKAVAATAYAVYATIGAYATAAAAADAAYAADATSAADAAVYAAHAANAYTKKYEEIFFNNINKLTELEKTIILN